MRLSLILYLFLYLQTANTGLLYGQVRHTVWGCVTDSIDRTPLAFASVSLTGQQQELYGTSAGTDGKFRIQGVSEGEYRLTVSYIGYRATSYQLKIYSDRPINVSLAPVSTDLTEVVVTASESKGITSASEISRTAMEHLQPTSFADLLALLPGGSTSVPKMNTATTIRLREAGNSNSDYDVSALGTSFVIDGMPLNTDADMQAVSSDLTSSFASRNSVNAGVDMRRISTDNIERVEIIRGIPSVQYGNLTSGAVIIERKLQATPVEARFKADQYGKLFSVSKGVDFAGKDLTLTADGGFLDSHSDPRNSLENYKRINASVRLDKKWHTDRGNLFRIKLNTDYTGSLDQVKTDPDILTQPEDNYRSSYHSAAVSGVFRWDLPENYLLKNIRLNTSVSASFDRIERSRFVGLDRDRVVPVNTEPGAHDAEILPYKYTAFLTVDGKPVTAFSQLQTHWEWKGHRLLAGASWKYAVNFGNGQVYDPTRPLNPTQSTRPRAYKDIPASSQVAFFLEDRYSWSMGKHRIEAEAGVRATVLTSVDERYTMHGKWYPDPRLNLRWNLPGWKTLAGKLNVNLSAGIGMLTKMPTLIQLYPERIYKDMVQLNYYHSNPEYKRINLYTYVIDPTNFQLEPARNIKWEVRLGASLNGHNFSVTYFNERMNSGFRTTGICQPYTYRKYDASAINASELTGPPSVDNLPYVNDTILGMYSQTTNGSRIHKRGVEFQLSTRRFERIHTRFTINGAWYRTVYENSQPVFNNSTTKVIGNVAVNDKYMGFYLSEDKTIKDLANTNFIVDTYLAPIGLKLSATVECMWYARSITAEREGYPVAYMDVSGNLKPFTEADADDLYKQYLIRKYNSGMFEPYVTPFYGYINFKATKDFGKHISVSIFADKLIDYVPDYERNGITVRRTATAPYFGMEMNIKL